MVEKTLIQMRLGGIYDQVGFGFHRYSTDAQWLVPHFEKMLYDQAMLIMAYTEAYQATYELNYLKEAIVLNDRMLAHFRDTQNGGLYMTADDSEKLLIRSKKIYDGAIPSGNSVATMNLLRLAAMTANKEYATRAESILTAHSTQVKQYPFVSVDRAPTPHFLSHTPSPFLPVVQTIQRSTSTDKN